MLRTYSYQVPWPEGKLLDIRCNSSAVQWLLSSICWLFQVIWIYSSTLAMAQKMVRITWKCSDHVKMFGSERPANGTKQQQSNRLIIALFLYRLSKIARFW